MARKMRQVRYKIGRWRDFVETTRSGTNNESRSTTTPNQRRPTTNEHPGFTAEVKSRRLARKRRKRKGLLPDSSNDEDEQPVSSNIAVNAKITDPIHKPTSHSQVDQPSTSIAQHEGDTLSDDESPLANVELSPCGQVDEDKTTNEQQSAPLSNNLTETENADLRWYKNQLVSTTTQTMQKKLLPHTTYSPHDILQPLQEVGSLTILSTSTKWLTISSVTYTKI